jgi:hypothetical protein
MGYGKKTVRIDFPDISDDGDPIYVTILNPRLASQDKVSPDRDIATGPDGKPLDGREAMAGTYEIIAKLVRDWHVYDIDDDADDPAPMPLPATPELVAKLPLTIIAALSTEVQEGVNPKSRAG